MFIFYYWLTERSKELDFKTSIRKGFDSNSMPITNLPFSQRCAWVCCGPFVYYKNFFITPYLKWAWIELAKTDPRSNGTITFVILSYLSCLIYFSIIWTQSLMNWNWWSIFSLLILNIPWIEFCRLIPVRSDRTNQIWSLSFYTNRKCLYFVVLPVQNQVPK